MLIWNHMDRKWDILLLTTPMRFIQLPGYSPLISGSQSSFLHRGSSWFDKNQEDIAICPNRLIWNHLDRKRPDSARQAPRPASWASGAQTHILGAGRADGRPVSARRAPRLTPGRRAPGVQTDVPFLHAGRPDSRLGRRASRRSSCFCTPGAQTHVLGAGRPDRRPVSARLAPRLASWAPGIQTDVSFLLVGRSDSRPGRPDLRSGRWASRRTSRFCSPSAQDVPRLTFWAPGVQKDFPFLQAGCPDSRPRHRAPRLTSWAPGVQTDVLFLRAGGPDFDPGRRAMGRSVSTAHFPILCILA
ncbi:hypothetical protein Rs2_49443 [Raphanus sativus]|nr:hypothetical protein Rs2_49443 [Raphanus sativus]